MTKSKDRKIIGFYGGTFDPIHFGHLNLAIQLSEMHSLDEVWFCPSFCSPFKNAKPPCASARRRLEMVRLAITGIPGFHVISDEIDRQAPSYTIETIRALVKKNKEQYLFRLLLSDEAAADLHLWKEYEELLRIALPLIGTRSTGSETIRLPQALQNYSAQTNIFEISSTEIRSRLERNLYCGHLVPSEVLQYIRSHSLYTSRF